MNRENEWKKEICRGFITLPAETGKEKELLELAQKWGADAIRDSDGTRLSLEMLDIGFDIYSTICLVRADQLWPREHKEHIAGKYLMSSPVTAFADIVEIDLLRGYFREKYEINKNDDHHRWWEVIDRTTGKVVEPSKWKFVPEKSKVIISGADKFHVYTVSFLVYQIWDSTSMYNHIINKWTTEHAISIEPYFPEVRKHLLDYFDTWLKKHANTDIVRLTTLAYHFTLDSDENGDDKYRDWLGYTDCITTAALEDFVREKGYRLRPEDFIDQGYYNATYRVPSKQYLDWMDFIHKFVVEFGRELVEKIHAVGKKAAIFWGDHWIGVEPYSPLFQEMKIDINIGACEDGVALRRLADCPGSQTKEIRLYPYFFPDVFQAGGKPLEESIDRWLKIRRAMLRNPVDRIGYGGYLSIILQFPEFVSHVTDLCNEFRSILEHTQKTPVYVAPIKVAVLNTWGKIRSWINVIGPDQKFHIGRVDVSEIAGSNMQECLCGLPVSVEFISFDDIKKNGIGEDIDVVINEGYAGTAWSGGKNWLDQKVVSTIREWIYNGGGFIGVVDPSACEYQGRFFQLADVLGVQKEIGNGCLSTPAKGKFASEHFIKEDGFTSTDLGLEKSFVYVCDEQTNVLNNTGHILIATNNFGMGRSTYFASLPYGTQNARLLHRAIFWVSRNEEKLKRWFSSNPSVDLAAYPETGFFVVVNNTGTEQQTTVFDDIGKQMETVLKPYASKWFEIETLQQQ
jgi:1,3-beta-galactosyl-N-acetylhexosamine phosphorylase